MPRPDLVIFDCDGVLVDSELLSNETLAQTLTEHGLPTTTEESLATYKGNVMREIVAIAEQRLGRPLAPDFVERYERIRNDAFRADLRAIDGVADTVRAITAAGIPVGVATQGKPDKTEMTLGLTGLRALFGPDAIFTAYEVARGKPFPDLYLHAAAAFGIEPARTAVIEDTPIGARAGIAAGMRVLGYAADSDAAALRAVGAEPFDAMAEVPGLLGL